MSTQLQLIVVTLLLGLSVRPPIDAQVPDKPTLEQYLKESAVTRELIDRFLRGPSWAQFDPELGYRSGELPALRRHGRQRDLVHDSVQRSSNLFCLLWEEMPHQHLRRQFYAVPPGQRRRNLAGVSRRPSG